jgi:hypothetical protein
LGGRGRRVPFVGLLVRAGEVISYGRTECFCLSAFVRPVAFSTELVGGASGESWFVSRSRLSGVVSPWRGKGRDVEMLEGVWESIRSGVGSEGVRGLEWSEVDLWSWR